MHGVHGKKKSKRMKLRMKYKIRKNVRDHHRKLRREMKKNPGKFGAKRRTDRGVPNSAPFKAKVINEAKEAAERELERKKELKIRRKEEKQSDIDCNSNISDFAKNAEKRGKEFEMKRKISSPHNLLTDRSAKAYCKHLKKVIDAADVILEVLDARDPEGTRCLPMEEMVKSNPKKRLVLVLNKADLVPKTCLESWLKYLRGHHPTIMFKSSTQLQIDRLSQVKFRKSQSSNMMHISARCFGANILMELLKNYCRNEGIKTAITVGVVGLPNVGKSSLINSLKRSRACFVGATPGTTKSLKEVIIDSKVRILDCPGVILPGKNISDASSCLRNAVRIDTLQDPVLPVQAILEKIGKECMMMHYNLPQFEDINGFLALCAKKYGKLQKGGVPILKAAAKKVLNDWNSGEIKYYTTPPENDTKSKGSSSLVTGMSKEFDFSALESKEESVFNQLPVVLPADTVRVESLQPLQTLYEDSEGEDEEECRVEEMEENNQLDEMEEDNQLEEMEEEKSEDENEDAMEEELEENENDGILPDNLEVAVREPPPPREAPQKKPRWETERADIDLSTVNLKKWQKKSAKKQRKEISRNEKRAEELTEVFKALPAISDQNYDFGEFFNK